MKHLFFYFNKKIFFVVLISLFFSLANGQTDDSYIIKKHICETLLIPNSFKYQQFKLKKTITNQDLYNKEKQEEKEWSLKLDSINRILKRTDSIYEQNKNTISKINTVLRENDFQIKKRTDLLLNGQAETENYKKLLDSLLKKETVDSLIIERKTLEQNNELIDDILKDKEQIVTQIELIKLNKKDLLNEGLTVKTSTYYIVYSAQGKLGNTITKEANVTVSNKKVIEFEDY
ncbi:MAG: hypothetical protein WCH34_14325 [Bacteroidota bacterium]